MGVLKDNYPSLRYAMGFRVGDTALPDPTVFTGAESDLDTLGKRDATGLLHRHMVATKHPLKFEWHNIPWSLITRICELVRSDKFQFTYFDPAVGAPRTMNAYVGDRSWEVVSAVPGDEPIGTLKFSVIEY